MTLGRGSSEDPLDRADSDPRGVVPSAEPPDRVEDKAVGEGEDEGEDEGEGEGEDTGDDREGSVELSTSTKTVKGMPLRSKRAFLIRSR